ncbi:MAG TPA: hypothetical protein PL041_07700 [Melioribacteraceae bacterium]|nr:hypothetical protein [Melioribacteraceae bacterium]
MVGDYKDTTSTILGLLENNKLTLGIKQVAEASDTIDFNIQAPFVYVHFDLNDTVSSSCGVITLTVDLFVGAADKNISEAKGKAIEITGNIAQLLLDVPVYFENSPLELFAEFSNKAVIHLEAKTQIRFGI